MQGLYNQAWGWEDLAKRKKLAPCILQNPLLMHLICVFFSAIIPCWG